MLALLCIWGADIFNLRDDKSIKSPQLALSQTKTYRVPDTVSGMFCIEIQWIEYYLRHPKSIIFGLLNSIVIYWAPTPATALCGSERSTRHNLYFRELVLAWRRSDGQEGGNIRHNREIKMKVHQNPIGMQNSVRCCHLIHYMSDKSLFCRKILQSDAEGGSSLESYKWIGSKHLILAI